jgi:hypothetical protein
MKLKTTIFIIKEFTKEALDVLLHPLRKEYD